MSLAPPTAGSRVAYAQLRGRLRGALRGFRKITGLTAVVSVAPEPPSPSSPLLPTPPIHPECARHLRSASPSPCREQWTIHLRHNRRSSGSRRHICPIGLQCASIPIRFDGRLAGVAKLVADNRTSEAAFATAIGVLRLAVSKTCLDSAVSELTEEVRSLRRRLTDLERIPAARGPYSAGQGVPGEPSGSAARESQNNGLVGRALAYLQSHYWQPDLSLSEIARALDCNPRYLTTRFTRTAGERMHAYLRALRVAHACRLLLETRLSVKQIAYTSGFSGPGQMGSAFRRHLGVSPGRYRCIFADF